MLFRLCIILSALCFCAQASSFKDEIIAELENKFDDKIKKLEEDVTHLKKEVQRLQNVTLKPRSEVSAAFSTRLHEVTLVDDDPLIFGQVDLNIGDGYNGFSGEYL